MKILHPRFVVRSFLLGIIKISFKLLPSTYSIKPTIRSHDKRIYDDDESEVTKLLAVRKNYQNVDLWYSTHSKSQSIQRANILPIFLAALYAPPLTRAYKLLDIGGGLGQTDLALLACNKIEIDLTIFEREPIVKIGMSLQKNNVKYESKFPSEKFDLVHIGSSLQYFYDFHGLIRQIINTDPTYIIITDTAISQWPTFEATQLNLAFTKIVRWIFNVDELNELMHGYTLIHRSHNYTPQHRFKSRRNKKLEVFHGNLIYMRSQG
jgi:putative methyltransferase (TIGR04325 family)